MGISGNGWKSFFSRKCSTTSESWFFFLRLPSAKLKKKYR
jgi:hypothetical protein